MAEFPENNPKAALPLKFSSRTKNNSYSATSTTSGISKPRLLTTPKALGSPGSQGSVGSRSQGSSPFFSKYKESKVHDALSNKHSTGTSWSTADGNNSQGKGNVKLSVLSNSEEKFNENGPVTSHKSLSWLQKPGSQPSVQHVNSNSLSEGRLKPDSTVSQNSLRSSGIILQSGNTDRSKYNSVSEKPQNGESNLLANDVKRSKLHVMLGPSVKPGENISGQSVENSVNFNQSGAKSGMDKRRDIPQSNVFFQMSILSSSENHGNGPLNSSRPNTDRRIVDVISTGPESTIVHGRRNENAATENVITNSNSGIYKSSASIVLSTPGENTSYKSKESSCWQKDDTPDLSSPRKVQIKMPGLSSWSKIESKTPELLSPKKADNKMTQKGEKITADLSYQKKNVEVKGQKTSDLQTNNSQIQGENSCSPCYERTPFSDGILSPLRKSLLSKSMPLGLDKVKGNDDGHESDEGFSFSMSSTSSFLKESDKMSDITMSPPISPFNSPLRNDMSSFMTSTPKSFQISPDVPMELQRQSLPRDESDNSSLKYSLVDIDITNSYQEKKSTCGSKSRNVTKSLSFSSVAVTPLMEALSLPTPSPRRNRKPCVNHRATHKLILTVMISNFIYMYRYVLLH